MDDDSAGLARLETQVRTVLNEAALTVRARVSLPGRPGRMSPIPPALDPRLQAWLRERHPHGLYSHQSDAISAYLDGSDVCLATATASGKSLVFMTLAAETILRTPSTRVLVLYPARALIQDQLDKWGALMEPLGLRFACIDGGIAVDQRLALLASAQVLAMTPDVTHAWMMSHLSEPRVLDFVAHCRLFVCDEAHVYEGAFGTNVAYLLRRLAAVTGPHRLICSTATLGEPQKFIEQLTGKTVRVFAGADDGSPTPSKAVLLIGMGQSKPFEASVNLLSGLTESRGRFLAFADSRQAVEQFVAACTPREEAAAQEPMDDDLDTALSHSHSREDGADAPPFPGQRILPYRSGYEAEDRKAIQLALAQGRLSGVVSTSALELGIDIGEIDTVLLLDVPPSMKAFWQRVGRAGRRSPAVCILLDPKGNLDSLNLSIEDYLRRPIEPIWLYLDNRYIQYAHVLCAATEVTVLGRRDKPLAKVLRTLPEAFLRLLSNELKPSEMVPADLYQFKQRGQNEPHHEFALRGAVEKAFKIKCGSERIGEATFSQALREAYPGAIYYYMARPYRILGWQHGPGVIVAKRARRRVTRPTTQTMVFPGFAKGMLAYFKSDRGFVAEAEMQVSERVTGFTEVNGPSRVAHAYEAGSPYAQSPLNRFFETTGICWSFAGVAMPEAVGQRLLQVFAGEYGVQERDLGYGRFHANSGPGGSGSVQGVCIYDSTQGSLRLTQLLAEHFSEVVAKAFATVDDASSELGQNLHRLLLIVEGLASSPVPGLNVAETSGDWVVVVAPGEVAAYFGHDGMQEVKVLSCRYVPSGLIYELEHPDPTVHWKVPGHMVEPLKGTTRLERRNFLTDEAVSVGVASEPPRSD